MSTDSKVLAFKPWGRAKRRLGFLRKFMRLAGDVRRPHAEQQKHCWAIACPTLAVFRATRRSHNDEKAFVEPQDVWQKAHTQLARIR